jgi:hypothetical protein
MRLLIHFLAMLCLAIPAMSAQFLLLILLNTRMHREKAGYLAHSRAIR